MIEEQKINKLTNEIDRKATIISPFPPILTIFFRRWTIVNWIAYCLFYSIDYKRWSHFALHRIFFTFKLLKLSNVRLATPHPRTTGVVVKTHALYPVTLYLQYCLSFQSSKFTPSTPFWPSLIHLWSSTLPAPKPSLILSTWSTFLYSKIPKAFLLSV